MCAHDQKKKEKKNLRKKTKKGADTVNVAAATLSAGGLPAKRGRTFARHCTLLVAAAKSDECVKCKLCYGEITAPKAERQLQRKPGKKTREKGSQSSPKTGKVT